MRILGIETSCDETSVAVVEGMKKTRVNLVYSQVDHARFGGIVPEIASRQQLKKLPLLYIQALNESGLELKDMDGIAVTMGPGLVGSLLVGVNFAKALSYSCGLPLLGINHLEGHVFSNYLASPQLEPPFVALIVSGGHTILVHVCDYLDYQILGQTRDDAAGEAYDKVSKLLGLGYPGGKIIDDLAGKGNPNFHKFPRAFLKDISYEFSFSGLKTAVVLYVKEKGPEFVKNNLFDICASFQEAVVDVLVSKAMLAARSLEINKIVLAGGVAANSRLREKLIFKAEKKKIEVFYPPPILCTDNAAMIASAGHKRFEKGQRSDFNLNAYPYLPLSGSN
ncbi:MAG TPA: tRNA (adenosine(37)-N6)-threonylcarbamoyltransferase complex transferase subunit TsaD [candidate division Zixibacteria bacterium]|nr:tRNA (adenosine(37)-N6)-threonylcarbamoyltransferase complex transferase subunit TsaD [candidate division Zixibacteria bacterium]HEQ99085.1 tRNA (adenosine(37)-N6)-threonylcarbamoyltransferase complex transferase subunit TsaD [candidate division Zixibacteria bacterium]